MLQFKVDLTAGERTRFQKLLLSDRLAFELKRRLVQYGLADQKAWEQPSGLKTGLAKDLAEEHGLSLLDVLAGWHRSFGFPLVTFNLEDEEDAVIKYLALQASMES